MTPKQLADFSDRAAPFFGGLVDAFTKYQIDTSPRQQMFLAQCAHESAAFAKLEENLNYSADALVKVWPGHFDAKSAPLYAHNPEKIANRAYANRMGNGDEFSGDGWRYRGRGLIQITGRDNYAGFALSLIDSVDLREQPDLLAQPQYGALAAGWFWKKMGLGLIADKNTREAFTDVTRRINGGTTGLADRLEWWERAKRVFV